MQGKQWKKLKLLAMILTVSIASINVNAQSACDQILDKCAQTVKVQKQAIEKQEKVIKTQDAVIQEQGKEVDRLHKREDDVTKAYWSIIGTLLLVILL